MLLGWKQHIPRPRRVSWLYLASLLPGIIWVMQPPPSTPMGGGSPEDRPWAKIPDG